jgi:hypothetical protein
MPAAGAGSEAEEEGEQDAVKKHKQVPVSTFRPKFISFTYRSKGCVAASLVSKGCAAACKGKREIRVPAFLVCSWCPRRKWRVTCPDTEAGRTGSCLGPSPSPAALVNAFCGRAGQRAWRAAPASPMRRRGPPGAVSGEYVLHPGDRLSWECDVDNDTGATLRVSDALFEGEACNVFGFQTNTRSWTCISL